MSDVAPIISLASARNGRTTSASSAPSSSAPRDSSTNEVPLVSDRLLDLLERIESCGSETAGALVFGSSSEPLGLVLTDGGRICWASATTIPGRLRRVVAETQGGLMGALEAARDVLRRYSQGDTQLGALLAEHCCEAVDVLSRLDEAPTWFERSRSYEPRFTLSPCEVFGGLSRLKNADLSASCARVMERLAPDASAVAFARPSSPLEPRVIGAVDGAGVGIRRLIALARWGEPALTASSAFCSGVDLVLYESREHGTTASWTQGGVSYVAWAPDGRALTRVLANQRLM